MLLNSKYSKYGLHFSINPIPTTFLYTEAVVTFEYEAQQDDELTLKVGNVISDVQNVSHLNICSYLIDPKSTLATVVLVIFFVSLLPFCCRLMRVGVREH